MTAEPMFGCSGVNAVEAGLESAEQFQGPGDRGRRQFQSGPDIGVLQGGERPFAERGRVEPQELDEHSNLSARRDVTMAGPVALVATVPHLAVRGHGVLARHGATGLRERLEDAVDATSRLSLGQLGRVGDEGFPQIEGDGAQRRRGKIRGRGEGVKARLRSSRSAT